MPGTGCCARRAAGLYLLEVGVAMLAGSGAFLHRQDFACRFIEHSGSGGTQGMHTHTHSSWTKLAPDMCLPSVCRGSAHQALRLRGSLNPPRTCPFAARHAMEPWLPVIRPSAFPGYAHLHAALIGILTDPGKPVLPGAGLEAGGAWLGACWLGSADGAGRAWTAGRVMGVTVPSLLLVT
jgi:hypothetical protein